jgi:hypothetical protein
MNRTGRLPVAAGAAGANVGFNLTIINETPAQFEVRRLSPTDVVIIARDQAENVVADRAGDVVAQELNNPNSKVAKSFKQNYDSKRRR